MMLPAQPGGSGIHAGSGQKNGSARTVHPISGSLAPGLDESLLIIDANSSNDSAPFLFPNASHAIESGRTENFTKMPPPAMWLKGRFSLKRKSAPGSSVVKGALPLGCQKFASSTAADLRYLNQP